MTFLVAKADATLRDQGGILRGFQNQAYANRMTRQVEQTVRSLSQDYDEGCDSRQPESVAAVLKVFGILQALAEQRNIGISEISQRLAMPKATVYRFLQTMKSLGYVQQEQESERYGLTMRIFDLGSKALQYPELVTIADEQMRWLSNASGETSHLGTLLDQDAIYIHKVDSAGMFGMNTRIGSRLPLHCSAIGKVMLAFEQPLAADELLSRIEFKPCQPNTHVSAVTLRADLDQIRRQGFAADMQEYHSEICCLAVPVLDYLNNVVAGLSVTLPVFRYNPDRQGEYVSLLHRAAREISRQLGCSDYPF